MLVKNQSYGNVYITTSVGNTDMVSSLTLKIPLLEPQNFSLKSNSSTGFNRGSHLCSFGSSFVQPKFLFQPNFFSVCNQEDKEVLRNILLKRLQLVR